MSYKDTINVFIVIINFFCLFVFEKYILIILDGMIFHIWFVCLSKLFDINFSRQANWITICIYTNSSRKRILHCSLFIFSTVKVLLPSWFEQPSRMLNAIEHHVKELELMFPRIGLVWRWQKLTLQNNVIIMVRKF